MRTGPGALEGIGDLFGAFLASVGELRALFTQVACAAHETIASVAANQTLTWRFGGPRHGSAVVLTPRLIVNEVESVLIAARAGRGLARVLSYQAADDLAAGALVRLLPEFEPPPLPVQLVMPGGRQPAPRVRAFIDHAVARLPELAPIGAS